MSEETSSPIATVIVPTVGNGSLVLPCIQRLLECTSPDCWQLLLVVNPVEETKAQLPFLKQQAIAAVNAYNTVAEKFVDIEWLELENAVGWTGAVNAGVKWLASYGMPEFIVIMNDDVLVTQGWLARMGNATQSPSVLLQGEVGSFGDAAQPRNSAAFGRIGIVGPCSNNVAGVQKIMPPDVKLSNGAAFTCDGTELLDSFAESYAKRANPYPMAASFLSGMCLLYTRECLLDLVKDLTVEGESETLFLRPQFGAGGYDDNDISVRAQHRGWRLVIAGNVYVHHLGHQTLDKYYPEMNRGMANGVQYLRLWEKYTSRRQRMVAVFRVGVHVPWDLKMLGSSIRRIAPLVDGIALLLTNSPNVVTSCPEWATEQPEADSPEMRLVERTEAEPLDDALDAGSQISAASDLYLNEIIGSMSLGHDVCVAAAFSSSPDGNERDERNEAIRLGMTLNPDWMMSVDHDEVPEDRITREHLQRLMRHPDPGITHYDVGWINHWDSPRLARVDEPWAQGYHSSMRGFRIWRITSPQHQQILAGNERGLHCGNVPDVGDSAKRVAAFRFRHYGYLRPQDRLRKYKRYVEIDPDPDPILTKAGASNKGGYDHLVNEEFMQMQPYQPANGIGLTMLWHDGENEHDLMRWLDQTYGMVDHCVLVWTGDSDSEPSENMQYLASRFGARWVHHPLDDDLAAARNAGVDALRELGANWCWVMDPDEHMHPALQTMISIRRMTESTDCWAWMFRFKNHRPGGSFNWSENTRLFKLQGGVLRFNNRVHETIEHGLAELGRLGVHPNVRFAPFFVEHYGLAGGDEKTQEKLQRYTRLLVKQIQDNPTESPGAWVSLGLQYGNDGMLDEQNQCFQAAVQTAGNGYLPFREAAMYHLREGRKLLEQAYQRLSPAHQLYKPTEQFITVLAENAPEQPILGKARAGAAVPPEVDLSSLLMLVQDSSDT